MAARYGGPEVLEVGEVPDPKIEPDQLLVRVEYAGLNFSDIDHRRGERGTPLPMILGTEGCGTVVEVGGKAPWFTVGDAVVWWLPGLPSSCSELAAIPAQRAVPIPDGVPPEIAVALMLQGIMAHSLIFDIAPVSAGQSVLIHSGGGGTGHLAIQLARLAGAGQVLTTTSPGKFEFVTGLGASAAIDYRSGDWVEQVRAASGGGVDLVYDGIGNSTLPGSIKACRRGGRCVLYGYKSGGHRDGLATAFDTGMLAPGTVFLTVGVSFFYVRDRDQLLARVNAMFDFYRAGQLTVQIGGIFDLPEAADAHRQLEQGKSRGKLLVKVG